jgi:hypothetical protein
VKLSHKIIICSLIREKYEKDSLDLGLMVNPLVELGLYWHL